MRVRVEPLGGRVTFTRVLALAFLEYQGRPLTWGDLREEARPGAYRLAVNHKDSNPLNCTLENLEVVLDEENEELERQRAAAGKRPPRGPARQGGPKRQRVTEGAG